MRFWATSNHKPLSKAHPVNPSPRCEFAQSFFNDSIPRRIRIEAFHLHKFVEGSLPEVLLVDNAIVADDEALHPGHPVLSWRSHQGKAPDHHAFHHKAHSAKGR